jgi:cellulose synthase/poly-beta-1,6-N-acetylglucosamine synthase-like glycosyltransferase
LATAAVLLAFSARRALLLFAAIWPARRGAGPEPPGSDLPAVIVLIPCRDEAASLPGLFAALDALDYPRDRLRGVLVDDGSSDESPSLARAWAAERPWAQTITLPANAGKAQALNCALQALSPASEGSGFAAPASAAPPSRSVAQPGSGDDPAASASALEAEVIVVYDADHRPDPNSLRALVAPLADPRVAGANGQMRVANGGASPAAAYTAIESLVNQFITMWAKDRLKLAPALLGSNVAYRRSALASVGGFTRGALLEDTDLTLAFALAGWRTRFVPGSASYHHAPVTLRGYWQQHLRWNRGFHQVSGGHLASTWRNPRLPWLLKVELTFFAMGYADRLALMAGAFFTLVDLARPGTFGLPPAVWAVYFGLPALEMIAALVLAGEPPSAFLRLAVVPFFFAFDIAIAGWSALASVLRRPARWTATERPS